ncbi:hypothetical protein REPUB_Repub03eG0123800 [Reevesia pubescens]
MSLEMGKQTNAGFGETSLSIKSNPQFKKGRFYDEYSAKRNDRLKRKKGETETEPKIRHHLGVIVERRDSK